MSSIPSREDFQKIDRVMMLLLQLQSPLYGIGGTTGVQLLKDGVWTPLRLTVPEDRKALSWQIFQDLQQRTSSSDSSREREIGRLLYELGFE